MNLSDIKTIYFIGIGGIGMSALARYFRHRGAAVHGYDRTETELTKTLAAEGMAIHYEDDPSQVPPGVDLVVFTPAVPATMGELLHFRAAGTPVMKRAEVLGIISRGMKTIAIAGTHGKTTTSSLTAHLLRSGGIDCTAFLGGIARNYQTNFLTGHSDWVVVEADEYDRSFLHLDPDVAVILSMDADHLDIYGDHETLLETGFRAFARKLKPGGQLWVQHSCAHYFPGFPNVGSFGLEAGQCRADNIRVEEGYFTFDYTGSDGARWAGIQTAHPGRHNVENAVAAITAARAAGVQEADVRRGLKDFAGIKRRFEYVVRTPQVTYIDDYAHHPTELEAAIGAARQLFPHKRITGIFQPHLFSRTRDFLEGFAAALDKLDEVLLLDIYPARELPIPGVTSESLLALMKNPAKRRVDKAEVLGILAQNRPEVLLTLGAGDIDTLVEPIGALLAGKAGA